jgi:hypothetical protein
MQKKITKKKAVAVDTANKRERQQLTVRQLLKTPRTPMTVRLWLEQYAEKGKEALESSSIGMDYGTMAIARLIHDVLWTDAYDNSQFPQAARDYVEEYLYTLAHASDIHVWNTAELAVTALPALLECAQGDPDIENELYPALAIAIERLTTRRERGAFLRDLQGPEKDETREDVDYKAAMKASRIIANPNTPAEARRKLQDAITDFGNTTQVHTIHPALVERAVTLMFENVQKRKGGIGSVKYRRQERKDFLALLDSIEEGGAK